MLFACRHVTDIVESTARDYKDIQAYARKAIKPYKPSMLTPEVEKQKQAIISSSSR